MRERCPQQSQVTKSEMECPRQPRRVVGTYRPREPFPGLGILGRVRFGIPSLQGEHQPPGIDAALASAAGRSIPALSATWYSGPQLTEMK